MNVDARKLYDTIINQLSSFWHVDDIDAGRFLADIEEAVKKTIESYERSAKSYYKALGFSELSSAVYAVFLCYLSNLVGRRGGQNTRLADQIYYLNKIMNCMEVYWNVDLPPHFIVDHPLGTVLGKAKYGDYLSVYQGVTVGGNVDKRGEWVYPELGRFITLYSNATVLGNSIIGDNVILSANSFVFNEVIPSNSIVFGSSPHLIIKTYTESYIRGKLVKEWAP